MNISYINILQTIESFASAHLQIKKFASDFPAQMPNFATKNEEYPILFVSPTTSIFQENTNRYEIDVYCFDIIQSDRENINTILSDTNLILNDLNRWMLDGELFGIDNVSTSQCTPIDNSLLDYAAGWVMRMTFETDTYGVCEIPFSDSPVVITEVNNIVYSKYLTCETLSECSTIIDINNEISGLTESKFNNPTGTTNEYILGNGTLAPISGITSLVKNITPDTYLGLRLTPTDAANNGFYINKSINAAVGYYARNTENTGNGSVAVVSVGGTGSLYENFASLFHANAGYFVPYLRGKNGLNTNNDFFFVGWNNSSFDFRTGNAFGSETSKFKISSGGTLTIGVQPSLDNSITDILGRKSDGSIVRVDKLSLGTVTSVGLSMPSAFSVANSPITSAGTISVTGAGVASQYVRGDGTLATLPVNIGGGSSVSYYLNGSVNQGTISGVTYYEMNKTPILGTTTDFQRNTNGYIASFLTDANDPSLLQIPAGNWNFETYFQASSGGTNPTFYVELYKYDGTTFSLIASNSATPKPINDGTNIEAYFSVLAVPQTTLLVTDRLAVRIYVDTAGRTITLHTENGHLCQVITTFSTGLAALNGLTEQVQFFQVGTTGSNFNISSTGDTHTFNLPDASASARGVITTGTQTFAGQKTFSDYITANGVAITNTGSTSAFIEVISNDAFYTVDSGRTHYFGMGNGFGVANVANNVSVANGTFSILSQTGSTIASFDASKNVVSLDTTTYPSLTELANVKGVTSPIQPQINAKANITSPTFSGTVVLPSTTSIGTVSNTEISYLDGVTSPIQTQIDAVNVNVITITTTGSVTTDTTSGGFGQHGRHVKISNGANNINIQCVSTSNVDFVASYEKVGAGAITFTFASPITNVVQLTGTNIITAAAAVGSKACLSRIGNIYYLQITNY